MTPHPIRPLTQVGGDRSLAPAATLGALALREEPLLALETAFSAASAIRHYWRNAGDQHGVFSTKQELRMLLSNIGNTPDWEWIVCETDCSDNRWTQACGNAAVGLVVEINGPHRVVPQGARIWPRENVGSGTWIYSASRDELHNVDEAATVQYSWLTPGTLRPELELRTPDMNVPRCW